ncbi:MAG: ferritin-like domain-containing protein [Myxococcales bacterium]
MSRGVLGRWAVRFLAAAGVSSAACSGRYADTTEGSAGSSGDLAGSKAHSGGNANANGGGSPNDSVAGEPPSAVGGATDAPGASGSPALEPEPLNQFPCLNPLPFGNPESGLERCDNGMIHRAKVGRCASANPSGGGCVVDADCPPTPNDVGTICGCDAEGVGTCQAANCDRDEACQDGFACVQADYCPYSPGSLDFACQTPDDQCGPFEPYQVPGTYSGCVPNAAEVFEGVQACWGAAGRPFLVEACPRTARTQPGSAWLEPSLTLTTNLAPGLRARLTAHWQHQAEMEHASVAAFARFVLELLSLGAPPELVTAATSALADETDHAKLCYAVASSYAERPLGPAQLDVTGALADLSLQGIVTRAVLEGCVGETLAAIEASEAASHASDSTLGRVLARIAEDEARHAELSWRFLRWVLAPGDATLLDTVRGAFSQARRDLAEPRAATMQSSDEAELLTHGVLSPRNAARLALAAFDSVIAPCADAILESAKARGGEARMAEQPRQSITEGSQV